jgi:hypothetical protein
MKGGDRLGDVGVNGRIILKWTTKVRTENLDWTHLDQDGIQ